MHKRLQPKKRQRRLCPPDSPWRVSPYVCCLSLTSRWRDRRGTTINGFLLSLPLSVLSLTVNHVAMTSLPPQWLGEGRNMVSTSTWFGLVLLVQHVIYFPSDVRNNWLGDDVENQQQHDVKAPPGCLPLLLCSWFFIFFYSGSVCFPYFQDRWLTANNTTVNNDT